MLADMTAIERSLKALLGYTSEQFDTLLEAVVREWEEYQSQYIFYGFVGQKA
jgi:hypothetical protein